MTDALLFLHVLSAFLLVSALVMLSAVALGSAAPARTISLAKVLWDAGGIGTLLFGIWLALRIDGYGLLDFWILAAIVLWVIASALYGKARTLVDDSRDGFARLHWLAVLVVVLLLADMIFKPGA